MGPGEDQVARLQEREGEEREEADDDGWTDADFVIAKVSTGTVTDRQSPQRGDQRKDGGELAEDFEGNRAKAGVALTEEHRISASRRHGGG